MENTSQSIDAAVASHPLHQHQMYPVTKRTNLNDTNVNNFIQ